MTGIDDRIREVTEVVERFAPVVMNGAVPERADLYKLACALQDVLFWIRDSNRK